MSPDVIQAAIDDTLRAPRPSWAYCEAILKNCDLEGVKTLDDWNERARRYRGAANPAMNYQHHTSEDMFDVNFFVDISNYPYDSGDGLVPLPWDDGEARCP